MAEPHVIVVSIKDGRIGDVRFCDCCPAVTLEVRTYTSGTAAGTNSVSLMDNATGHPNKYQRDERGTYRATYFEPEGE